MRNRIYRSWHKFKHTLHDHKGKYFHRLIWVGMVSSCVPVLLAGLLYYQISVNNIYLKTEDDTKVSLKLVSERVENIFVETQLAAQKLVMNPLVSGSVSNIDFEEKIVFRAKLLDLMGQVQQDKQFIMDIVLYEFESNSILSAVEGTLPSGKYKPNMNFLDIATQSSFTALWYSSFNESQTGELYYIHKVGYNKNKGFKGLIIVQVNADLVRNYFKESILQFPGRFHAVTDSDGKVLLYDNYPAGESEELGSILHEMNQSTTNSDFFRASNASKEQWLYAYQKAPSARMYVTFMPEENLYQQLVWIRWVTAFTCLGFVSFGIILTIITSISLYSPIQQLILQSKNMKLPRGTGVSRNELAFLIECLKYVEELNHERSDLSAHLNKLQPDLRERFLQRLLQNNYSGGQQLLNECVELKIPIEGYFSVIVAEYENIYRDSRFSPDDKSILEFALANIMNELLGDQPILSGNVVSMTENNVAVVLYHCGDMNTLETAQDYALSIVQAVKKYLKLQVSIGMGSVYTHISDIGVSYDEALTALRHRIYLDSKPIYYFEAVELRKKQSIVIYPAKEEKQIIDCMGQGDLSGANQGLHLFSIAVRKSNSYTFVFQSYHLLLASVIRSMNQQESSLSIILENNLFDQLKEKRTTLEICNWYQEVCFPLLFSFNTINDSVSLRGKNEIQLICDYIRENINSDISLTRCAEMVSFTPNYVSTLFKKMMGFSFVEYVVHCKVEEAKRLLVETDFTLAEIASTIGYSERNLSRVFQKLTDMTPGSFRNRYK